MWTYSIELWGSAKSSNISKIQIPANPKEAVAPPTYPLIKAID